MVYRVGRVGGDHVAVIFSERVLHMLWMVAMRVNRAALDRQALAPQRDQRRLQPVRAIHDRKFGPLEATRIEVIKELAPGSCALSTRSAGNAPLAPFPIRFTLDRKQDLSAVTAHADRGSIVPALNWCQNARPLTLALSLAF